jgi:hypothetical protein
VSKYDNKSSMQMNMMGHGRMTMHECSNYATTSSENKAWIKA